MTLIGDPVIIDYEYYIFDVEDSDVFFFSELESTEKQHFNDICAICKDENHEDEVVTVCGHFFHADCVQEWFERQSRCPFCCKEIAVKIE